MPTVIVDIPWQAEENATLLVLPPNVCHPSPPLLPSDSFSARAMEAVLTDLRCVCSLHRSELQRGREREGDNSDMACQITVGKIGEPSDRCGRPFARMATLALWLGRYDGDGMRGFCAHLKRFPTPSAFSPSSAPKSYLCGFL